MIFADTSLLFALYRNQVNSTAADNFFKGLSEPCYVSSLVAFELRQSTRLQAYRFSKDRTQGFPERQAQRILGDFQSDIADGILVVAPVEDWASVLGKAEQLSDKFTVAGGFRTLDVLHVATALDLRSTGFATFDEKQAALARASALGVFP